MRKIAGLVLAAGAGVRMGGPKADLVVDGVRLVDRAAAALRDGGCDPVLAVVRPGTHVEAARTVVNPAPESGLRSSLAAGVDAAMECELLLVLLVDQPGIGSAVVRTMLRQARVDRVTVARYGATDGHPIVMSPAHWREALQCAGADEGARTFVRERQSLVTPVDVTEAAELTGAADGPIDLDDAGDLVRWRTGVVGPGT